MILSNRSTASLRALAVVVAAVLAPAIAGCEAGFNAPTQRWHQSAAGASTVVHNAIRINNVFLLGAPPRRVHAVMQDFFGRGMDDESLIVLEYDQASGAPILAVDNHSGEGQEKHRGNGLKYGQRAQRHF